MLRSRPITHAHEPAAEDGSNTSYGNKPITDACFCNDVSWLRRIIFDFLP